MFGFKKAGLSTEEEDSPIKQVNVTHTCNGFDIGTVDGMEGLFVCNPVTGNISGTDGSLDDVLTYCRGQANPLEV